jgi:hypothetical protein
MLQRSRNRNRDREGAPSRSLAPLIGNVASVAALLACLIGIGVAGVPRVLGHLLELEVGDMLRIASDAEARDLQTMNVEAVVVSAPGLAPGSRCAIGVGAAAAEGGALLVTRYDPAQSYRVTWAGAGRSSRRGQDCGNVAELQLRVDDVRAIRLAPFLASVAAAIRS